MRRQHASRTQRDSCPDTSGALRDMVQNHLLQVVGLTAMEPPATLQPDAIRYEILKVFQSLRPIRKDQVKDCALRGQYVTSHIKGLKVDGYRDEEGVIHFKPTPHSLFFGQAVCHSCNQLVMRIQPDEGILLKFGMKIPGAGFEVQTVNMDFHYDDLEHQRIPSAYERLIFDSIKGDSTLFARTEEVIEAWEFLMPVLEAWENNPEIPLHGYPAGTWGPSAKLTGENLKIQAKLKEMQEDGVVIEACVVCANAYEVTEELKALGIIISTVYMAKGLEFDQVIVPFAAGSNYKSETDRQMLYVACTRAMHRLDLTYTGKRSLFLSDQK